MEKNNFGFSLVELMIAAAIMAGLSLVFMQMNKTQIKATADTSANVDALDLKRNMISTLMDKSACAMTFSGYSIGQPVPAVKSNSGTQVFAIGNKYGEGKIIITSMATQDLNLVGSDGLRSVNLNVGISKTVMGKVTPKSFSIALRVKSNSANGPILDCFSDTSGLVNTAKQEACASLGGTWDTTSVTCTLPSCPGGQVLQALKPDGSAVCKSPSCVAPQMFQGLDATGAAICVTPNAVYQ